ncbi:DUF1127 domain-containing protein [Leisingera sp. JC1]|uniref:DUF1127 domain-containing protein n=1 Tax=Leisingera sp. JC1 TaxID=1855282 RepID=UPI0009F4BE88|nr:DUF1127 domain-containing protein [Leisingera sp. JC1]
MAITRSKSGLEVVSDAARTIIHQNRDKLRSAIARRKIYRTTCHELSVLSDRDLADLGIARSSIRRLALEAAYGH